MPVIGRLDSQVNDVLIEPVGNRRPRDGRDEGGGRDGRDEGVGRAPADDARRAPTSEASRDDAEGLTDGAHDDSRDGVRRDARLPVWLL